MGSQRQYNKVRLSAGKERISIKFGKSKTKIITTTNQNKGKYNKEPMSSHSKNKPHEARENACEQVTTGLKRTVEF